MRRLLKKFGDLNVSESAAEEMRYVIGEYSSQLAKIAVTIATEEGRKTVMDRHVRTAKEMLIVKEVNKDG
jgi:histone H3/H4